MDATAAECASIVEEAIERITAHGLCHDQACAYVCHVANLMIKSGTVAKSVARFCADTYAALRQDDPDNLQSICQPCHMEKTAIEGIEARGGRPRKRQRIASDGWPID